MYPTLLYRLFGLGRIPRQDVPRLQAEGIVLKDEGIPGWLITNNLRAPGRWSRFRREGFSGSLVLTHQRFVVYGFWRRLIHIPLDDPLREKLQTEVPGPGRLVLTFESAEFREGWRGVIELQLRTRYAEALVTRLQPP